MDTKKHKTILIVDDEEPLRRILRDVLEKENYSILEAKNGREAVDLSLKEHPDLILLDLLMPEVNGMDALEKIRTDAWGVHVPVIILTNLSANNEEIVEDMVKGKPAFYLIKSDWKIHDVVKKIEEVFKV